MQIIRWQEARPPQEQELRRRMQSQGLAPSSWSNGPGDRYAVHSHNYQKVLYCVSGSINFILPDQLNDRKEPEIITLKPGDCMILPAGVRHGAEVGGEHSYTLEMH